VTLKALLGSVIFAGVVEEKLLEVIEESNQQKDTRPLRSG
jgi:hypothetical protein